ARRATSQSPSLVFEFLRLCDGSSCVRVSRGPPPHRPSPSLPPASSAPSDRLLPSSLPPTSASPARLWPASPNPASPVPLDSSRSVPSSQPAAVKRNFLLCPNRN